MDKNKDISLFQSIKNGDEIAFEKLFQQYYYQLCVYAREFVKKNELAEEVVEDVFCKIWKKKATIEIKLSVKSYLYKAVYHTSLNYLESENKHSKSNKELSGDFENHKDISTTEDFSSLNLISQELEQKIKAGIESLPDQCKMIFKMSRFEGLKYIEIASKLSLSIKTVETQMSRALTKLRKHLKEYLALLIFYTIDFLVRI